MAGSEQAAAICYSRPRAVVAIEWAGCVTGLFGSYLVAANVSVSGFGFVAFLASNMLFLAYGIKTKAWGIVTMQMGYTGSSVMGIMRWLA
ncbi:hypothetical protein LMG26857_03316 [Achromobacter anxifer]|uniref:hypothetical protein n=1 Tax=Achromobacter anxifer TaxID=1287737 RepID=UPI00155CEE95|nr:hypothetical protein [Achromobacter anxifer]CAB5514258.1 hypothetical protein LMG26857_03316 [Achromobacter anxifer]